MERLSKYLARTGVASRRAVDEYIRDGRIIINGRQARLGEKVDPEKDRIYVDGRPVGRPQSSVYLALNKPPGYLSTCSDPFGRPTVMSLVKAKERVFPVGRLDYDTAGLLFLTNDGDFAYLLTHPKHKVVKEYAVKVSGEPDNSKVRRLLSGIIIDGKRIDVDFARFMRDKDGNPILSLGVHEGEKHLVKKLCRAVGYKVLRLTRVRIGPIRLSGIPEGKYRHLTDDEVRTLYTIASKGWEGESNVNKRKSRIQDRRRRSEIQSRRK
jgi:pseudouridine synthase